METLRRYTSGLSEKPTARLAQLALAVVIGGFSCAALLLWFAAMAPGVQAAPPVRPLAEIITGTDYVTHTPSTTHQMRVFANGRITDQFFNDIAVNQIGSTSISATTIAVVFDQHTGDNVDVGSQLEFSATTPITLNTTSSIPGYSEDTRVVYASRVLSYQITQRTLATTTNNCVIMELDISNTSSITTLTGGRLLYMVDIQVGRAPDGDEGGFDPVRRLVYQRDYNSGELPYAGYAMGISLLEGDLRGYGVNGYGYPDPASDTSLKTEMITPTNAIADGNNDVSWLVANVPDLPPGQDTLLVFGLCARDVPGSYPDAENAAVADMLSSFDQQANLSVAKTATPTAGSSVVAGEPITYRIALSSTGYRYVNNIVVTDTIPASTDLITYSVSQGSITAGNGLITATIGRLYSTSGTVTVTLVVKPWITSTNGAVISNQAFIKSEPIVTSTNVVTHQVINAPVLTVTKRADPDPVARAGDVLTYTIVVSAGGQGYATGVIVSDTLPANTRFVSDSITLDPPGAGAKGTASPTLAHDVTITAGQSVTVTYAVTVNTPLADGTVITNTASATCTQVPTPAIGVVTTTIRNPVFTLTKQTELAFGVVGKPFTYTLTITNTGPVTATDVVVTDTLPTGANYISGGTLVAGDTVSWTIPTIPATSATQVSFVVSTCQTSLVNAAYRVVTSTQGVTSPPGSSLLTLLSPPTLEAQFSYSPPTITVGSPVYFTSTSTTNGGPIVGWGWSFGDSGTGSGSTISHAYTAAGTYTATLTITDTCGFTGTVTNTVVVTTSVPALVLNKWAVPDTVPRGYDNYILYSFQITNTGDVPLTDIQVWDDTLKPSSIGSLSNLPVSETHTFLRGWSPRSGWYQDVHNVATATARAPGFPGVLSATDDAYVDVVGALSLVLDVSVQPAQIPVSQTVTYTYYLTNSSSDWMEGGTITDTVYGVITSGLSLAPGAGYTRVLTQWVAATTVNMAYARGTDRLGKTTAVTDSAQVTVGVRYIYLPVIMKNH